LDFLSKGRKFTAFRHFVILLAPSPSTIKETRGLEEISPDPRISVDRPTGRSFALHELVTPQIDGFDESRFWLDLAPQFLMVEGVGPSSSLYEAGSAYRIQPDLRSNARAVDRSFALRLRYSVSDGPCGHCARLSVARVGHISRQFHRASSRSSKHATDSRSP
jgi:hypothetical protein